MPRTTTSASTPAADDASGDTATVTGPQGGTGNDSTLVDALDARNLEQALLDFATANARVLDLTRRLCTLNEEVVSLRDENVRQMIELERLRRAETRLEALERSRAVKLAGRARKLAALGRRLSPTAR